IAVATVPTLEGDTVESYSVELFKRWGVGKKGKDNGVLILVAPSEHKTRIEVGYGLESQLTDGTCGEIIREEMLPAFRQNKYGPGLVAAVAAIQRPLGGDTTYSQPPRHLLPPLGPGAYRTLVYVAAICFFVLPFTMIAGIFAAVIFLVL